jgi:ATP-binding cassette subfamily B multidrug efflux pump
MDKKKGFLDFILLRRIFAYTRPYSLRFYLSVFLAIALAVLAPIRPILINKTLARVNGSDTTAIQTITSFLLIITLIQIGLLIVEAAMRFLFSYMTSWIGHKVVKDIRVQVFNKILSLNLRQFDKTPIGTLTTRTINDIEAINDIFSEGLVPIIADFLSIIAVLAAMFYTDIYLTLICLIPFPIMLIATYFFKESVNKSFTNVRNAISALNAFVQEHISGMQVIQAFTAEEKERKAFETINRKHRDANIHAIFAYSVFFPIVEIVLAFSLGLLVWFAATEAYDFGSAAAIEVAGKIVSFMLMLNLLFRPLRVIADKFNVLQMGMVAGERVMLLIDNDDLLPDNGKINTPINGDITFDKVSFYYNEGVPVLKNVSFSLKKGQSLAIVGKTGSGKTTIINLINRMYQHQSGQILLDGIPVEEYSLSRLRAGVGIVLQDVFLFSGSVLDNVTLRNPAITREEVRTAARLIGIDDFIESLPGGYDYHVMERGATLSLGQRQLLSFLRALLYKPSILILDEATSSVDSHTEKLIQHAIEVLTSGRTSIIIAHRLSTIQKADQILLLEKGEVMEQGDHSTLLKNRGQYAQLIELQTGDNLP